ncbi:MAG: sodium:calcium symporter [Planctomycetes bacterium]|nr:sodium:calcium symporter [Planctomycetota bacterium]
MSTKHAWGSRLGVILAVAGSAVGLGNFLRFPGNAAQNGGGAFMIPYFCALLLLGIPIGWAEWTMGRYGGRKGFHSAPAIMGVWGKGSIARYFGGIGILIPVAVYFWYVLVESWCLAYCWDYLVHGGIGLSPTQSIPEQVQTSSAHFAEFTGQGANGANFTHGVSEQLVFWIVTTVANVYLIYRGLSKGIESFCKWAMPAMAVCGLIVLGRVLTLGTPDPTQPDQNVMSGLGYMWNPDFSKLNDAGTWIAAAGQIFFSLSVGFGVIINYASYMRRKDDVVLSGLTSSATNEFFEVALGGLITLTAAVAFMGVAMTTANTGGTFSTGFNALPVVFAHMDGGRFFGAIWFFMLWLAAITSSLSMLQPAQAFLEEALGLAKNTATTLLMVVCLAGNVFVLWYSKGLVALDTIDFWVGTVLIFVLAGVQIVCFGWVVGMDRGMKEAHEGARMKIPGFYRFIIQWVAPLYLIVVFGAFCWQKMPGYIDHIFGNEAKGIAGDRDVQMSWLVILVVAAGIAAAIAIGTKRWRAQGLDVDGTRPPDDETAPAKR